MKFKRQFFHSSASHLLQGVHPRVAGQPSWLFLTLSLLSAVCVGINNAQAQGLMIIDALGQPYTAAKPAVGQRAHVTFYRLPSDGVAQAVSVYIDGAYHTSLLKSGYTDVCLQTANATIGLRQVEEETQGRQPVHPTQVNLKAGQQLFFKVSDQNHLQPLLQEMSAGQAAVELGQTRQQIHTISRATTVVPCEDKKTVD